jgi:hypothetical protein
MVMMYRDHKDPLYYDPTANDKIFVPVLEEVSLRYPARERLI